LDREMEPPVPDANVCVVVVNYATPGMVTDCLETLVPQARELGAVVAVVDNASPDDSVQQLRGWISDNDAQDCVNLVESPDNDGFAAGNNVGIKSCHANFYLLLNSDTLVRDAALEQLTAVISSEPDVGLVSPRLEWPDAEPQESCFRYHRPVSELIGSASTGPVTRLLARYEVPMRVSDERVFPEWTSFACVMIRHEVFEQVGLLDDGFFMYFEDVEFCYRARAAGWKILHDPAARVVHLRGGSSPVKSRTRQRQRLPRYFYESRTRYFYKLYGRVGLLAANCWWTLGWMVSLLRTSLQRTYESPNCQAQWRDIWINFWKPLASYTHPRGGKR
jgi:N-acetylglucosaminyl-diphospho-decaprenol L-rhamnosyltransferase